MHNSLRKWLQSYSTYQKTTQWRHTIQQTFAREACSPRTETYYQVYLTENGNLSFFKCTVPDRTEILHVATDIFTNICHSLSSTHHHVFLVKEIAYTALYYKNRPLLHAMQQMLQFSIKHNLPFFILFPHLLRAWSTTLQNKQIVVNVQVLLYLTFFGFITQTCSISYLKGLARRQDRQVKKRNRERTSQAPWVSKGSYEIQAQQTGSKLHTGLWVDHPCRQTGQDGVCWWEELCHVLAESPQWSLPLQSATNKVKGTANKEWMRKNMILKHKIRLSVWRRAI